MIIVDYSGIALASIIINKTFDEQMIRHMILNSLRMYRKRYKEEYGEMILAVDASNNWRRKAFPQYKANRKKDRGTSTFDWNEAFRILNKIREEIAENFPYRVVRIDGCEADDVMGTLVTMNPDHNNDFNPQKVMIGKYNCFTLRKCFFYLLKKYSLKVKVQVLKWFIEDQHL